MEIPEDQCGKSVPHLDAHLELGGTLAFLCYFRKKAPSYICHWVLNTPLKLTVKAPEQFHPHCSSVFIVDFEHIGFHAYITYFTHSCFHS